MKRALVLLTLSAFVVGVMPSPAQAHEQTQYSGQRHCEYFDYKALTNDSVVENPQVKIYDQNGALLAAEVALKLVINAKLVVCVEVDAEAVVKIALDSVIDEDKNGKKDTIVVKVTAVAKADVNVKIIVKVEGKLSVFLAVRVVVDIDATIFVKAGEQTSTKCYGRDGIDMY